MPDTHPFQYSRDAFTGAEFRHRHVYIRVEDTVVIAKDGVANLTPRLRMISTRWKRG